MMGFCDRCGHMAPLSVRAALCGPCLQPPQRMLTAAELATAYGMALLRKQVAW